jgi:hypothetical protein
MAMAMGWAVGYGPRATGHGPWSLSRLPCGLLLRLLSHRTIGGCRCCCRSHCRATAAATAAAIAADSSIVATAAATAAECSIDGCRMAVVAAAVARPASLLSRLLSRLLSCAATADTAVVVVRGIRCSARLLSTPLSHHRHRHGACH